MGMLNNGLDYARDLLIGDRNDPITHFAWGASGNVFNATDTALGSELFPSGAADTRNTVFSTISQPQEIIFTGRIESDQLSGGSILETALANTASGAIIITRQVSAKRLKTENIEFVVDYYLQVKDI